MPKLIEPGRWERFVDLLARGWYPTEAAREVGIDPRTAQKFIAGDARCSGRRWLEARKAAVAIRREIASPQASTSPMAASHGRGSQGGEGAPPADPPAPIRGGIGRGVDRPAPIVHHHQESA